MLKIIEKSGAYLGKSAFFEAIVNIKLAKKRR